MYECIYIWACLKLCRCTLEQVNIVCVHTVCVTTGRCVIVRHMRGICMYTQLCIPVRFAHTRVCVYTEHIFVGKARVWPVIAAVHVSRDKGARMWVVMFVFISSAHYCRRREDVMASANISVFLQKASIKEHEWIKCKCMSNVNEENKRLNWTG